jgi:hypothetical protein
VFLNYTYKRFEGLTQRGTIPTYMKAGKAWNEGTASAKYMPNDLNVNVNKGNGRDNVDTGLGGKTPAVLKAQDQQ